jgi:hypothetical protein
MALTQDDAPGTGSEVKAGQSETFNGVQFTVEVGRSEVNGVQSNVAKDNRLQHRQQLPGDMLSPPTPQRTAVPKKDESDEDSIDPVMLKYMQLVTEKRQHKVGQVHAHVASIVGHPREPEHMGPEKGHLHSTLDYFLKVKGLKGQRSL